MDPRSPVLDRLACARVLRHTRDGRARASAGLALVLALEVPLPRLTSAAHSRATGSDRDQVRRQPAVGTERVRGDLRNMPGPSIY
jgi:hypothetical protein